jgi:hypothetical protein
MRWAAEKGDDPTGDQKRVPADRGGGVKAISI